MITNLFILSAPGSSTYQCETAIVEKWGFTIELFTLILLLVASFITYRIIKVMRATSTSQPDAAPSSDPTGKAVMLGVMVASLITFASLLREAPALLCR